MAECVRIMRNVGCTHDPAPPAHAMNGRNAVRAGWPFYVDRVRRRWSDDGTHQHVDMVFVRGYQASWSRDDVIGMIRGGVDWFTWGLDGSTARILVEESCGRAGCASGPHLATPAGAWPASRLEALPGVETGRAVPAANG